MLNTKKTPVSKVTDIKFIRTYHIAQWLRNIVIENDPEEFLLEYFEITESFQKQISRPQKKTILHDFIIEKLQLEFEYEARKCPDYEEWNEMTSKHLNLEIKESKFEEDFEYRDKLEQKISTKILPKISEEVFYLLFSDREFLFNFNLLISEKIKALKKSEFPELLKKDGVINRATYWSKWLKNAIFYRDKGTCCNCFADISGLLNTNGIIHLDHIIPLNKGGTNDTTNIQLLCSNCNLNKKDRIEQTSYKYFKHY